MKQFISYYPVREVFGDYLVASVGSAVLEEGETVDLFDGPGRKEYKGLEVVDLYTGPASVLDDEWFALLGVPSLEAFIRHLSAIHKTAYGPGTTVTLYWFARPEDYAAV